MITLLRGILLAKAPTEAVVDVGGVGYGVQIPVSTFEALGDTNTPVTLHTYLHVREDALVLYGFATGEERDTFRLLISVNGIGPKMAQGILSGIGVQDLKDCIARGNVAMLTTVPGVGRKTGERLVVELREKIGKIDQDLRPPSVRATSRAASAPRPFSPSHRSGTRGRSPKRPSAQRSRIPAHPQPLRG